MNVFLVSEIFIWILSWENAETYDQVIAFCQLNK